jgi:hypothetical protein
VTPATRARLQPIIDDMQQLSDAADASNGTSEYQVTLVSLGLVARHYLRELAACLAAEGEPENQSACLCEIDKHDFNCPIHNDFAPESRKHHE